MKSTTLSIALITMCILFAGVSVSLAQSEHTDFNTQQEEQSFSFWNKVKQFIYRSETPCDPNYAKCVPIASDVDCAGGHGNGPEYTKRVRVVGDDIYDLDRDEDGVGCE
ncbi:hypothetical protein H6776_02755 [Candidatus Nomurabacteria bacterium]|nr:hypothetical protein [Candidatus Nomurabacteria bacterium]